MLNWLCYSMEKFRTPVNKGPLNPPRPVAAPFEQAAPLTRTTTLSVDNQQGSGDIGLPQEAIVNRKLGPTSTLQAVPKAVIKSSLSKENQWSIGQPKGLIKPILDSRRMVNLAKERFQGSKNYPSKIQNFPEGVDGTSLASEVLGESFRAPRMRKPAGKSPFGPRPGTSSR